LAALEIFEIGIGLSVVAFDEGHDIGHFVVDFAADLGIGDEVGGADFLGCAGRDAEQLHELSIVDELVGIERGVLGEAIVEIAEEFGFELSKRPAKCIFFLGNSLPTFAVHKK
jgi:hypothetical protein